MILTENAFNKEKIEKIFPDVISWCDTITLDVRYYANYLGMSIVIELPCPWYRETGRSIIIHLEYPPDNKDIVVNIHAPASSTDYKTLYRMLNGLNEQCPRYRWILKE